MLRQFNTAERVVLLAILINHFSFWPSIVIDSASGSGLELAMLSGLLIFGYTYIHLRKRLTSFIYMNMHVLWLIAWFVYGGVLMLLLTNNIPLNLLRFGYLASMLLAMLSVAVMIRHKVVRFTRLMEGWVYLALFIAPVILIQYLVASFTDATIIRDSYDVGVFAFPRAHGFSFEPLFFANWLLPPIIYMLYTSQQQPRRHKWATLILGVLLFLSVSRGAFFALSVAIAIMIVRQQLNIGATLQRYLPLAGGFVIALLLIGTVASANNSSFLNGIGRYLDHATLGLFNSEGASNVENLKQEAAQETAETGIATPTIDTVGVVEDSTKGRLSASQTAIDIYMRDPLTIATGIGLFRFGEEAHALDPDSFPTTKEFTNNQLLDVIVETGLIGFGLLVMFVATSYGVMRNAPLVSVYIIAALCIQFISFSGYFLAPFWIVLGCIIGSQQNRIIRTDPS